VDSHSTHGATLDSELQNPSTTSFRLCNSLVIKYLKSRAVIDVAEHIFVKAHIDSGVPTNR
ncbi:MAG: hypothetical protein Harvfovirus16_6, partial [Harvfovirus sp.]